MPFDPCGAICDLIRRPYTTKMRPFKDSDLEVDIVWYPAKPGAPCLAVPSVVCSLDWWKHESELGIFTGYKVGEVPDRPRTYNGEKVKPLADGTHRCGTDEMFHDGAAFDPNVNRPKRPDGLPTCCGDVVPGVAVGGKAPTTWAYGGVGVNGSQTLALGGNACSSAGLWNLTTTSNVALVSVNPGFGASWTKVLGLATGRTYRFRFWLQDTTSTVDAVAFLSCFFGGVAIGAAGPGASYYEFTGVVPAGYPDKYIRVFNTTTGVKNFFVQVIPL